MHEAELVVDEELVRCLLAAQLPELADRPLTVVEPWGTDNALWRLGNDLLVRLPRIQWASGQPEFESTWLPRLTPYLAVSLPRPVALGEPGCGYPYRWAVQEWITGDGATLDRMDDPVGFGRDLAEVVRQLQTVPSEDAPIAQNRARPLKDYDDSTREYIQNASGLIDTAAATAVWEEALAAPAYEGPPVWVHGDLEGNCLVRQGRLTGVVDWGSACAGDPAVDVQVVWSPIFTEGSRHAFLEALGVDDATLADTGRSRTLVCEIQEEASQAELLGSRGHGDVFHQHVIVAFNQDQQAHKARGLLGYPGLPVADDIGIVLCHRRRLATNSRNVQCIGRACQLRHRRRVADAGPAQHRLCNQRRTVAAQVLQDFDRLPDARRDLAALPNSLRGRRS